MSASDKPAVLLQGDKDTALWKRIKAHCEAEIVTLDKLNRQPWPAERTTEIRGQIKAFESILRLDKQAPGDVGFIERGQLKTD